ncbi:hypothetical protein ACGF1Z_12745 [Streptomyces sp. NPDC048018]
MAVFFDGMDAPIYGAALPCTLDDPGRGLTPARAGVIGGWTTVAAPIGAR